MATESILELHFQFQVKHFTKWRSVNQLQGKRWLVMYGMITLAAVQPHPIGYIKAWGPPITWATGGRFSDERLRPGKQPENDRWPKTRPMPQRECWC